MLKCVLFIDTASKQSKLNQFTNYDSSGQKWVLYGTVTDGQMKECLDIRSGDRWELWDGYSSCGAAIEPCLGDGVERLSPLRECYTGIE